MTANTQSKRPAATPRADETSTHLATARLLDGETACCSLGAVLGLGGVDEQALYDVLDWLLGTTGAH